MTNRGKYPAELNEAIAKVEKAGGLLLFVEEKKAKDITNYTAFLDVDGKIYIIVMDMMKGLLPSMAMMFVPISSLERVLHIAGNSKITKSASSSFTDFLWAERAQSGLSYEELSKKTGIDASALEKFEAGETEPSISDAESICNALGAVYALGGGKAQED